MPDEPLRFAHPFFTDVAPAERPQTPHGRRMADFAAGHLTTVPVPRTASSLLDLVDIIGKDGVAEIAASGQTILHAVGDTGRPHGSTSQEALAAQMAADYSPSATAQSPAFFLHLGDVVYGPNKDAMYRDEFYRAYAHYPGKIVAIAGNHDGEIFTDTDPDSLRAFVANFCAEHATIPAIAKQVGIFREAMIQPGVYFRLKAPFIDVIGLYTNVVEGPGNLLGSDGDHQVTWLATTLGNIAAERAAGRRAALVVATHHPPFSNAGHSGSPALLEQLDIAFGAANLWPDAVISGHAHNYQRHTRTSDGRVFVVAGCGGNGKQAAVRAPGPPDPDHHLESFIEDYGYLRISVSQATLRIDFHVLGDDSGPRDSATIALA